MQVYELSDEVRTELILLAQQASPYETGGFIDTAGQVWEISNGARDPLNHYEPKRSEYFQLREHFNIVGIELTHFWHSHPHEARLRLSDTDLRTAANLDLHMVLVNENDVRDFAEGY